ncbi:MAG: hypothetical protein AAFY75_09770 [Pseudomonadota bacterium]
MKVIGNKKYPDKVDGVLAKPGIAKVFRAFVKEQQVSEILEFYEAPYNPEKMYWQFLRRDAPKAINVGAGAFRDADDLKGKWDDPDWSEVINSARNEMYQMLQFDILLRFWSSDIFNAYHASQGGAPRQKNDSHTDDEPAPMPPKIMQAAKRLGVKDVESLRIYVAAMEKHGLAQVAPVGKKLLRKEGLSIKLSVLNQFLIEAKIAKPAKTAQPEALGQAVSEVRLNRKALGICGFENMRSDKALARIRAFILAMEKKDKRAAEVAFAKIMKEEPPTSLLNGYKLIDLFKAMKKRRAFELTQ